MDAVRELSPRLRSEAMFAVIKISPAEVPRFLPPRDGAYLASRFRRALPLAFVLLAFLGLLGGLLGRGSAPLAVPMAAPVRWKTW